MSFEPWALVGQHTSVRFNLVADAYPGLLPRLLQPFARRNLTPDTVEATRRGDKLHVEIALEAMPAEMLHLVEGNLRQVVGVTSVTRRDELVSAIRRRAA